MNKKKRRANIASEQNTNSQKWKEMPARQAVFFSQHICLYFISSGVDSRVAGVAGGARPPSEFGGSEKGWSLISAYYVVKRAARLIETWEYWSLAITESNSGFEKLSTAQ